MPPETALAQALHHHRAGNATAAITAAREAVRTNDPTAQRLLGLLLAEAGHLSEARAWTGRAVNGDPSAETLCAHGRVLALQQHWTEAAIVLREALALRPVFPAARALLDRAEEAAGPVLREAEAHFTAGRFPQAAALFRDASAIRPDDAAILHALGTALHEAGRPIDAIPAYRAALSAAPDRIETWHNLGSACQATGNIGQAMHAYARAYALDPACFPRIAQELAAGPSGQVWLSGTALRARLQADVTAHEHDTRPDTRPAPPAPPPPPR